MFFYDLEILPKPLGYKFVEHHLIENVRYYWAPISGSDEANCFSAACITTTAAAYAICKNCEKIVGLVNGKRHFETCSGRVPPALADLIAYAVKLRDLKRSGGEFVKPPINLCGNLSHQLVLAKQKVDHGKDISTLRRHDLRSVFPTFTNFRTVLSMIGEHQSAAHGKEAGDQVVLTTARLLNMSFAKFALSSILTAFDNPDVVAFEQNLVYQLCFLIVSTGALAITGLLNQMKQNAGLVFLRSLWYLCDYIRERFTHFNWIVTERVELSNMYKRIKAFQKNTLSYQKHRKLRLANVEQKISIARDYPAVGEVLRFYDLNGKNAFVACIRQCFDRVLNLCLTKTRFELQKHLIELRVIVIGLLNIGVVPSRCKEFQSLSVNDLKVVFESFLRSGFDVAGYGLSSVNHKTVHDYGAKVFILRPEIVITLLVYVAKLLKPMDTRDLSLDGYLATCRKFLIRTSYNLNGAWGVQKFAKYGVDFGRFMNVFFGLNVDVQIWRKAYSSLVKNSLERDNKLLKQVMEVLAAGNSHGVGTMNEYYCIPEKIKEAIDSSSCREFFLGPIPKISKAFKPLIRQFLLEHQASRECLQSLNNYFNLEEFEDYLVPIPNVPSYNLSPVDYPVEHEELNFPETPVVVADNLTQIFGGLRNPTGTLCWLNSLMRLLQRVIHPQALKGHPNIFSIQMEEILSRLSVGDTLTLSNFSVELKKTLPAHRNREFEMRSAGEFIPFLVGSLPEQVQKTLLHFETSCLWCESCSNQWRDQEHTLSFLGRNRFFSDSPQDFLRTLSSTNTSNILTNFKCGFCASETVRELSRFTIGEKANFLIIGNEDLSNRQIKFDSLSLNLTPTESLEVVGFSFYYPIHYITYIKCGNKFLKFDDINICEVTEADFLKRLATSNVLIFEIIRK